MEGNFIKREHPMLFNSDMVNAILSGRKIQTRRIWKNNYSHLGALPCDFDSKESLLEIEFTKDVIAENGTPILDTKGSRRWLRAPWSIGELMYVRESFAVDVKESGQSGGLIFKASFEKPVKWNWRPSIHMRKEDSRIWLQIVNIRFEKLCSISQIDSIHEGIDGIHIEFMNGQLYYSSLNDFILLSNPIDAFKSLWGSAYGPFSWDKNPWVYVIDFEVVSTTGKENVLLLD